MSETALTISGNLVDDPEFRYTPTGHPVARFRVASTPRVRDGESGQWRDGDPLFMTCTAWRQPAENIAATLTRGMGVIVTGRLRQRSYEATDGTNRTVYELTVDDIGPSLKFATAEVKRAARTRGGQDPAGDPRAGTDTAASATGAEPGNGTAKTGARRAPASAGK